MYTYIYIKHKTCHFNHFIQPGALITVTMFCNHHHDQNPVTISNNSLIPSAPTMAAGHLKSSFWLYEFTYSFSVLKIIFISMFIFYRGKCT